ncbi:DUF4385 domain-containing protein [Mucilaginibacter glaciei]|uniref:DUF4385 domain-containing protein n=1 Tax=Mucilaginibacter glaciei TaxID=2772109 RepID=A0A926NWY6_9SPHI|nr:DUF4385 domain-containing protein [Mucilaginibacter glaciei]MBD1393229.1 DUF4385 domain-containing protein [Mucilaginibacter glaciei]
MADKPSYLNFDKAAYHWRPDTDYRANPEEYRVGKGEQGVLICEPYKSEIGQYWRFKTVEIAEKSSEKIYRLFLDYIAQKDFVGADMARKFLQMGFTRAGRYANYKGGKKYDAGNNYQQLDRGTGDEEKARAAQVFYKLYKQAEAQPAYQAMKVEWKKARG